MSHEVPDTEPEIPEGIPKPPVPTMVPQVPPLKTLTGKYARRVMAQEEYDLFCETWIKWYTAHPEWRSPEDEDDVITICMETVLMFRLQKAQMDKPTLDISEAYNQSFKRKQRARENLTARRVDKVGTKNNSGTIINVAVLAGEVTPQIEQERRRKKLLQEADEAKFLEGTVVRPQQTLEQIEDKEETK